MCSHRLLHASKIFPHCDVRGIGEFGRRWSPAMLVPRHPLPCVCAHHKLSSALHARFPTVLCCARLEPCACRCAQMAMVAGLHPREEPWSALGYLHHGSTQDDVKGITHWVIADFDSPVRATRAQPTRTASRQPSDTHACCATEPCTRGFVTCGNCSGAVNEPRNVHAACRPRMARAT